jgi:quinolinate synthase
MNTWRKNIAKQTNVEVIYWHGKCEVHERFTPEEILSYKEQHEGLVVIAHPECSPEVVDVCDFTGSTCKYVRLCKRETTTKSFNGHRV